jgi:alpha-aminoadipic semialdehyde synthase
VNVIGIRREDKHDFERRVPLTPEAVQKLSDDGIPLVVQPSPIRAYPDAAYEKAGADVNEDLSSCDVVFAVKEIPEQLLREGGTYVFFSHTIKGQPYNMPMLRRLMELGCTLIDYEKITDDQGRRLVFFGRHAGLAGMIDTLAVVGQRLEALGTPTVLSELSLAHEYPDLEAARDAVIAVGARLAQEPLPASLAPFVVGFAGYGNVSKGAQEIVKLLPHERIDPDELPGLLRRPNLPRERTFAVEFEERHLVEPKDDEPFVLQDYYDHPERYRSIFHRHAPHLSVLVNAIYWTEDYPRLISREQLRTWFEDGSSRLIAIGDISCDIEGAIEMTSRATTPDAPSYVYDPASGTETNGVAGKGVVMMTTDCLPCELPRESSASFTDALLPFVPEIAEARLTGELETSGLPEPIRRACILWRGELTESFSYLKEHAKG